MSEKDIERRITKFCRKNHCVVIKLAVLGMRGWPDLTIIAPRGRIYFIEVKDVGKGNNTSVQQRRWLETLKAYGFKAEVFTDSDAAAVQIQRWLEEA